MDFLYSQLTTLSVTQTMKELNLYPQETLILEER